MVTALLVLDDATLFPGRWWGAQPPALDQLDPNTPRERGVGEVVFNTAMSGYHEVLTDPSYTGQLVVMTYPHVGNYGCDPEWSETGPERDSNRPRVKAAGFVLRSVYDGPVPEGRGSLNAFLRDNRTPGITDVDTRALTLHLRDAGSRRGIIVAAPEGAARWKPNAGVSDAWLRGVVAYLHAFPDMEGRNLIGEVGSSDPVEVNPTGRPHIALLDCGLKANIVRELVALGCRVTLFPSGVTESELRSIAPDALLVSNGPGDPAVLADQIETVRACIGTMPVFGICLGHQLIAEAVGAKTFKMKFGHHGVNHPVRDEETGKVFVTSQNHGFSVEESSLPAEATVWFRNANDQTVEGIRIDSLRVASAQFHPESAPGPYDSRWIFSRFLELMAPATGVPSATPTPGGLGAGTT